jgi:hypothetical protein
MFALRLLPPCASVRHHPLCSRLPPPCVSARHHRLSRPLALPPAVELCSHPSCSDRRSRHRPPCACDSPPRPPLEAKEIQDVSRSPAIATPGPFAKRHIHQLQPARAPAHAGGLVAGQVGRHRDHRHAVPAIQQSGGQRGHERCAHVALGQILERGAAQGGEVRRGGRPEQRDVQRGKVKADSIT